MAEFRTGSGTVECKVFMRTGSGLVEVSPQFRTGGGLADAGNSKPIIVTANPDYVFGAQSADHPVGVATNVATVSASGGKAPYTYSWGPQASWTIARPTSAETSFSRPVGANIEYETVFTCTVTDASGATGTVNVTAQVSNFGRNDGLVP